MVIFSHVDERPMANYRLVRDIPVFIDDKREASMVEMGRDDITVSCTQGRIVVWFGRQVGESIIHQVIFGISCVDSSVYHELEVICDFKTIGEYENMGCILVSYSKTRGGYRTMFNIPFSRKFALDHFVKSIVKSLREKDIKKTLHWDGDLDRIILIYNELKRLDGWDIKRIDYKNKNEKEVSK